MRQKRHRLARISIVSFSPQPTSPVRNESNPVSSIPEIPSNFGPFPSAPENAAVFPQFTPMADPVFTWGKYDSEHFTDTLNAA